MGWYDAIKDGISLAQKADNLPLVQSLIDAQKQILDLMNENNELKKYIEEIKRTQDLSEKIERHDDAYSTLADDEHKRIYCSCCWDVKHILVQGNITNIGKYHCPSCGSDNYYDREAFHRGQAEAISGFMRGTKRQ